MRTSYLEAPLLLELPKYRIVNSSPRAMLRCAWKKMSYLFEDSNAFDSWRDLEAEVAGGLNHGIEVGDARVVDEGRDGIEGARVVDPRSAAAADAVGLQDAERLEDLRFGDAGHAQLVAEERRQARDPRRDARVSGPAGP